MNREDIQEEFRKLTQEPTRTLNKCEVGVKPKICNLRYKNES